MGRTILSFRTVVAKEKKRNGSDLDIVHLAMSWSVFG
jgi:hypothetical protein